MQFPTKADKIRSMSDEELAILFAKVRAELWLLDRPVIAYNGKDVNENYDWLRQPIGGKNHERNII